MNGAKNSAQPTDLVRRAVYQKNQKNGTEI